jgi:hypothetical protein
MIAGAEGIVEGGGGRKLGRERGREVRREGQGEEESRKEHYNKLHYTTLN